MIEELLKLAERYVIAAEKHAAAMEMSVALRARDGEMARELLRAQSAPTCTETAGPPEDPAPDAPEPKAAEVVPETEVEPDRDELVRMLTVWGVEIPPRTRTTTLVKMAAEERAKRDICVACEGSGKNSAGKDCPICKATGMVLPKGPVTDADVGAPDPDPSVPEPPGLEVDLDLAIFAARALMSAEGRPAVVDLLSMHSVEKITELDEFGRLSFLLDADRALGDRMDCSLADVDKKDRDAVIKKLKKTA